MLVYFTLFKQIKAAKIRRAFYLFKLQIFPSGEILKNLLKFLKIFEKLQTAAFFWD